jgi:addiction module RelE/StbE family toxin
MNVFFARRFRKSYNHLQPRLRKQCDERLRLFETEPFHDLLENHSLHGEYAGCRSINVTGDYRAIFYHESESVVRFIAIGTHHELFGN